MTWLQKLLRQYPSVQSTSFLSPPIDPKEKTVLLTASLSDKIVQFVVLLFAFFVYAALLYSVITDKERLLYSVPALCLLTFVISRAVWNEYGQKDPVSGLLLTADYLEADGSRYSWSDINGCYIIRKMEGRYTVLYLVLTHTDSRNTRLNLRKIHIHQKRLAGWIEFFRRRNQTTTNAYLNKTK